MLRYTLLRIAQVVPVIVLVAIVNFFLLRAVPGDPAAVQAGIDATPEVIAAARTTMGLDEPVLVQLVIWLGGIVRGDFGSSYVTHEPVAQILLEKLPVTLQLATTTIVIVVLVAVPLGVWAGLKKDGKILDGSIRMISLVSAAVPSLVLGMLAVLIFGFYYPGVMPIQGYVPFGEDPVEALRTSVLPALALAAAPIGIVLRMTRSGVIDAMQQEYVTVARALGVEYSEIVWRDVLRNALLPVLTLLGVIVGYLLSGTIVVETIFGIPGLGRELVESFGQRNYPVAIGVMLFISVVFLLVNLATDLLYGVLNPRIRAGYAAGSTS